jgi:hypothetical protein
MKRHSRIGWEGSPLGCLTTCRNSSRDRSRRLRQSTDRRGAPRCRPSTQYSQSTTPRPSQGRGLAAQPIGWSHGPLGFRRRRGRRGAASGTDEEERTSRRQWRDVPTSAAGPLSLLQRTSVSVLGSRDPGWLLDQAKIFAKIEWKDTSKNSQEVIKIKTPRAPRYAVQRLQFKSKKNG